MATPAHWSFRTLHRVPWHWRQAWQRWLHPVRDRLQRDPLARLNSLEEVAIAAELGVRIDVNQATVDDWLRLPDISIHQARTLATLSQQGVAFHSIEDVAAALGVSAVRLRPLTPVLQFCYYDTESLVSGMPLSLNQTTVAELRTIPGLSATLIERIVNERRRSPFVNWADVHHRLRLTAAETAHWMHYLRM